MSTTPSPPEPEPGPEPSGPSSSTSSTTPSSTSSSLYGWSGGVQGARMPIPGNAEFFLFVFIEIVFVLIWIIADSVNTAMWVEVTTVLAAFYFLSRGIAKASRVLEQ
jgi:hypothetical protein